MEDAVDKGLDPLLVRALVAGARHAASGEVLPERVLSARHLGDGHAASSQPAAPSAAPDSASRV